MIVYSNSCSFGAPNQGHKVYADYVAQYYNAKLINRGEPGSCNRRIIRTTLRDLNELPENQPCIVLLGLTFVFRTELWQPDLKANSNDGHFHSITVDHDKIDWATKGLIKTIVPDIWKLANDSVKEYYKQWLLAYCPESAVTELLTDLIMLTGWLKNKKIKYVIFSAVDVLPSNDQVGYNSPFLSSLKKTIDSDKDILDPWNFSFGGFALSNGFQPKDFHKFGCHGHPGGPAHEIFGKYLTDYLKLTYPNDSN